MPLMQQKATVVWSGDLREGSGKLNVGSGAIPEQTVTFKVRTEGGGTGTTPEELLAAAHAICYSMSLSNRLTQNGTPPEKLEVTAVCSLDRVEGGLKIGPMQLNATGNVDGLSAGDFENLAREAEQKCPVSNALRGNMDIELIAKLAG